MCQKVRVWWISVYAFELMYYVVYSVTKYYPPEYAYCCVVNIPLILNMSLWKRKYNQKIRLILSAFITNEHSIFQDKFHLLTSYPESDMVDSNFAFLEQWKYKGSVY